MNNPVRRLSIVVASVGLLLAVAADRPPALAQGAPPMLSVDLIVPASGYVEGTRTIPGELCAMLPAEASIVTVSRRALVPEAGTDRRLTMTITPFASTADPLVEKVNIRERRSVLLPELGGETCCSFENAVAPRQAQDVAQAYKYFAQIVTLEVR